MTAKFGERETILNNKNIRNLYRGISKFMKDVQTRNNIAND